MPSKIKISADSISVFLELRDWEEFHGITLCTITLDEEKNMKDFYEWHKPYVDYVVTVDGGSKDETIPIVYQYADSIKSINFLGHFGNQKNRAIELARNDWVLFLDPDERLSVEALKNLRTMIDQTDFDCYSFPRKNFIDDKVDDSHGTDYQQRLFRSYCRYVRPVHEELVGWKKSKELDPSSDFYILHRKSGLRHGQRNHTYKFFTLANMKEIGSLQSQSREEWERKYSNQIKLLREKIGVLDSEVKENDEK